VTQRFALSYQVAGSNIGCAFMAVYAELLLQIELPLLLIILD
jgi:hypothetical protein